MWKNSVKYSIYHFFVTEHGKVKVYGLQIALVTSEWSIVYPWTIAHKEKTIWLNDRKPLTLEMWFTESLGVDNIPGGIGAKPIVESLKIIDGDRNEPLIRDPYYSCGQNHKTTSGIFVNYHTYHLNFIMNPFSTPSTRAFL